MNAPDCTAIFEASCPLGDARIVVVPVPFEGTTSYGKGTAGGPTAIIDASHQLDFEDPWFGRTRDCGIAVDRAIAFDPKASPDEAGTQIESSLHERVSALLRQSKIPAVLGGEHSISLGSIRACADRFGPIGVLQVDAHMDLRLAYQGFTHSHASVMHEVLDRLPDVRKLVQVGIRDYCAEEVAFAQSQGERVEVLRDDELFRRCDMGESARAVFVEVIASLPERVYVSFDIDGLDPSLCPNTGTPVPGGLGFNQASLLLQVLAESGRTVVGFDLVEVAPSPGGGEWDANVGARVLYKLCGCAVRSQG